MADLAATFGVTSSIQQTLPVGTNRVTAISAPYSPAANTRTYSSDTASGTGAGGMLRYIQRSGSLVATTLDIDLATTACSDATVGLVNWRECRIDNTSATDTLTVGLGTGPFTSAFMGGTTPTIILAPGASLVISKPLGTTGYAVSGANICRLNSGSATVPYRVVFAGN